MTSRFAPLATLAAASLLALPASAGTTAKPRFVTLPNHLNLAPHHPASTLAQWNGSFTDLTHKVINYTMVGTNPSTTKHHDDRAGHAGTDQNDLWQQKRYMTFDPGTHVLSNGKTVVQNTLNSPLFVAGIDFVQAGPISARRNTSMHSSGEISGRRSARTPVTTSCWNADGAAGADDYCFPIPG